MLYADSSSVEHLNRPSLKDIYMEISIANMHIYEITNNWEDIGIQLDIADEELAAISREYIIKTDEGSYVDSKQAFRNMIRVWVKQVNPPPTWSNFVKALERLNIVPMFTDHLRSKYCGTWKSYCMVDNLHACDNILIL